MPTWMTIDNNSTPARLAAVLSLIVEGRAVRCPSFSLAVHDGTLRIDVDYPVSARDDTLAARLVSVANRDLDLLLASQAEWEASLSARPRRIALIQSNGNGEVEIAYVQHGHIAWHATGIWLSEH